MAHLSTFEGFLCGGLAGCIAMSNFERCKGLRVTFSNPAEVAKTRMQLQGELMKSGSREKVYKNVFNLFVKTWRNEGLRGGRRGLGPAYFYQVALNGSRLGLYEQFRRWTNEQLGFCSSQQLTFTSMGAGAVTAIVGSYLGNPLFLVKTRKQAYSPALSVGAQRYYRHGWDALATIVREEGVKGLLRGWDAAILWGGIGGSVQLPSYIWSKTQLVRYGFDPNSTWTFLASSSIAGVILCLVVQPADTTLTRMYNQPTVKGSDGRVVGALYKNPIYCL